MVWRNEYKLFKKKDAHTGKEIFSQYHSDSPLQIYSNEFWMSDGWDPMDYGRDYDFSKSFFPQFRDLLYAVPAKARSLSNEINSEYCNNSEDLKNCYLCFNAILLQDCAYTIQVARLRNCFDLTCSTSSENCYDSINITDSSLVQSSIDCAMGLDLFFCADCRNCSNCVGCVGLRSKSHCIFNVQYSKEEYQEKFASLNLDSHLGRQAVKAKMLELYFAKPHKYMHTMKSVDSSGDYIFGSKNTKQSWVTMKAENVKYAQDTRYTKDAYDTLVSWKAEDAYEGACIGLGSSTIRFVFQSFPGIFDVSYSAFCSDCSHCFGCVGLRYKEYCIFNKQYTKEEYNALVPKIIEQMKTVEYINPQGHRYAYGEFFPPEFSPLAYNDTIASDHYPLTEEEIKSGGFITRQGSTRDYAPTLRSDDIPDKIENVSESILNQIIECEDKGVCVHDCTKAFRITAEELAFYKKMNIPPPHKCPNCRLKARLVFRGGLHYFTRGCMCDKAGHDHTDKCQNKFETSYHPDGLEIVYCESCYNKEVY
jgi:hypothetical protein